MRILLTGGTGFIGGSVATALADRGDEVWVVSRRTGVGRFRIVAWEAVQEHVERADAVVHLAGEPIAEGRWTPERLARLRGSRVDTTDRLARAIAASTRKPRVFVSASAIGIYGMRRDDVLCDEGTPPGDDVLARMCVDWESAAQPAASAGVRVVHPRIGIVLGRGGALAKMEGPFRWFLGGPLGNGTQWMSTIHVRDVVRALLLLLDVDTLSGAVNLVGPAPATMNEVARAIGRALGRPSSLRVPAFALRLALGRGVAELLLSGQRVVPRRLEATGFTFEFPTLDGALADLR